MIVQAEWGGYNHIFARNLFPDSRPKPRPRCLRYDKAVDHKQLRAAGRVAGKMARSAGKSWAPTVKNSGTFVKHVVPAAVRPLHALWHEILGFIFLAVAATGALKMYQEAKTTDPILMILAGFLVLVTAGYGLSSILKARRITRAGTKRTAG